MASLTIYIIYLLTAILICISLSKHESVTPQFGFTIMFLAQAVYAVGYINEWYLSLSFDTLITLCLGIGLFIFASFLTSYLYDSFHRKEKKTFHLKHTEEDNVITVDKWKMISFILIQLSCVFLLARYIRGLGTGSLSTLIYFYRHTNLFTESSFIMPGYLSNLRTFCRASGYVWSYILINNYVYKDSRNIILLLANLVLSVLCGVLTGGRGPAISLATSCIAQIYIINGKKNGWNKRIRVRKVFKFILIVTVVAFIFVQSTVWLGRTLKYSFADYLSIYLSAELKNLDTFIRIGKFGAPPNRWQTIINVMNFISNHGFHPEWRHQLDIPFQRINGYSLGNVYTIFYAFLYDGGMLGLVFYTLIMAVITQLTYKKSVVWKMKYRKKIDISVIIYSCIFYSVVFSFFSNKFYENVFSIEFIKFIIVWNIMYYYLFRIHINSRKQKMERISSKYE